MARPFVGSKPLKRLVGQSFGWQTAIGPRVNDWEGAPSTGNSPDDKYLLPTSIQSLEGEANGTSTAGGILSTLNALEGTANGTSTASGNLINLVYVAIEGTANGTSTATADLTTVPAPSSPSDAAGLPNEMRLVPVPTPATAVDEGIFFLSNGAGGLNDGEPYWVPESSGTPISLYEKTYVEDLADTLIFGDFTDGSDIIITNGDMIRSANSGAGVPGRPVVLSPGTTVDTDEGALVWGTPLSSPNLTRGKGSIDLHAGGYYYGGEWMTAAGSNYTAIVGGQWNTIGRHGDPTESGSHYSGIFGGYRGEILRDSTHSVIIGGGAHELEGPIVQQNRIFPDAGRTATHNAIVASYNVALRAVTLNSNCNFIHAVWGNQADNLAYSAVFGASSGDILNGTYMFISGVFHDIFLGAGATHGNEATAIFGRLNDTYSAKNSALFCRFTRLGDVEGIGVRGTGIGGNSARSRSDYSFIWANNQNSTGFTSALGGYVGSYSLAFGVNGQTNSGGQLSIGSHNFASWPRGCQLSEYVRRGVTTDATPLDITQVAAAPNGLQINLPSASATTGVTWNFEILVVARQTGGIAGTVGDSAMWLITGCIKYLNSTATTAFVGVPTGTGAPSAFNDAGAVGWTVALTADDTDDKLVITVTGEVNKTISWMARVTDSEVRGGV